MCIWIKEQCYQVIHICKTGCNSFIKGYSSSLWQLFLTTRSLKVQWRSGGEIPPNNSDWFPFNFRTAGWVKLKSYRVNYSLTCMNQVAGTTSEVVKQVETGRCRIGINGQSALSRRIIGRGHYMSKGRVLLRMTHDYSSCKTRIQVSKGKRLSWHNNQVLPSVKTIDRRW